MDVRLRVPGCISHYLCGLEVNAGREVEIGAIVFEPGASLVGWVEAGRGHRLSPAVRVEIAPQANPESAPSAPPSRWTALRSTAVVTERGFFHFQGVAPGTYRLIATQPDGPPSRPFVVSVVQASEVMLERPLILDTWANVEVQVIPAQSPEGEPWRLELRDVDVGRSVFETVARTIADEGGRARLERLTPGEFTLRVSGSRGEAVHSAPLVVEPGEGFFEVRLGLVEVKGSVTLGKKPLAATVWFGGQQGSVRVKAIADEKGKFVTFLPRSGEWIVEVIGEGVGVRRRFQAVDVGGPGARARTVDLVIPATWIRGEVVQENGARATGALVTVTGHGGFEHTVQLRAEGGEFEVWGLDPGPVMIRAQEREADSDWVPRVLRDDGEPAEVRLHLRRKTTLAGRVVTAGRPVPGAALAAWSASAPAAVPDAFARTGPDGLFELRVPASAREVMVTVEAAGLARRMLRLPAASAETPIEVPVTVGGATLVVQFERPPEPKDPIFSGYLVVHNGVVEDYCGLEAWARRHGAAVDGSARVAILALEDGTYTLCRGGVGEYAALAAGIVLPDRCRSVFLPPGGEVVVSPPWDATRSGGGTTRSDQRVFPPPETHQFDALQGGDPQTVGGVGEADVMGGWGNGPFLAEVLAALGLDDGGAHRVGGHRIAADQESPVGPGVRPGEVVRSGGVELGGEHDQNVEAGLSLDVGQMPDGSQRLAGVGVVGPRVGDEHDVVLDQRAQPGPVVGAQGAHVDEGSGGGKHRVLEHRPVGHGDALGLHAGVRKAHPDRRLEPRRGGQVFPLVALHPDGVGGCNKALPGGKGVLFVQ